MISNRTIRYPAMIFAVLVLISLAITYLLVVQGTLVSAMVILATLGIATFAVAVRDYRLGLYIIFILGMFMFYIDRVARLSFPIGTIYDALVGLVFVALFVNKGKNDWTLFKNPVTITFLIIIAYQVLQLFNPNANSAVAWLVSLRNNISFLIYVICFQMFSSVREVKRFLTVWLVLAFMVAGYGIYQEMFGLTEFEWTWLHSVPERINLYLIWGKLRKFSFLSDPSSYGLFMAASSLCALMLAMGPFKTQSRMGFGLLTIIMLIAMSYSGTRTAMAMVAVGIAFYMVLTLHNKKMLLASIAFVVIGAALVFGPFYGGTMSRIRSTFNPSEDPSMAVRDVKRVRLQEYVRAHPIGGGLYTTGRNGERYSPGHELAGPWDPDSGYLLTALETGWIGLLIFQALFFIVLLVGIRDYFSINDPLLKTYTLAFIVPFLALSVAHFTQDAMFQKPANIIVYATYALVIKIPSFQKKLYSVDLV